MTNKAFQQTADELRSSFKSHKTLGAPFRKKQLECLLKCLQDNTAAFVDALQNDLKSTREAELEVHYTISEVIRAIDELNNWMSPKRVEKTLIMKTDSAFVKPEPMGLALIISPWNYPLVLAIEPLIGAIAAGCVAIVKPSEIAEKTAEAISKYLPMYLDSSCYKVVTGGVEVAQQLLELRYDFVFYTGSPFVGAKILESCAKHLTPAVLELGGKSPCIVSKNCDLSSVANRIIWGKCLNAGQTCIAPDYVLFDKSIANDLLEEMKKSISAFYGSDAKESKDYGRIISVKHWKAIVDMTQEVKSHIVCGGVWSEKEKYISPTLLLNPPLDSKIMKNEIFGPILPVIPISNIKEAVSFVNSKEKPLSLYVFSKSDDEIDYVLQHTSSGGVCVNDVFMHSLLHSLPFGGVGNSGMGRCHGKATFDAFSNMKSVLWRSHGMEFLNNLRYPPSSAKKTAFLNNLMFSKRVRNKFAQLAMLSMIFAGVTFLIVAGTRGF